MVVVNLYNEIYRLLTNDDDVLNYLGIDTSMDEGSVLLQKARKVQKRRRPQNPVDNVPLITFYTPGGGADQGNYMVFNSPFVFDVYTNDDVDLAQRLSSHLVGLLARKNHPMCGVESYETKLLDAFESSTDLSNVYCFTAVIRFSVTI